MKREAEDNRILEYVKRGGNQVWIGVKAPFDMPTADMLGSSNYRVSSSHHHSYDVVWFFETLLDDVGKLGWKIVVDELIRLIGEQGRLIIRIRDRQVPSLPLLKMFLGRHVGIKAEIEYETHDELSDIWTVVFRITRFDIEKYSAKDWTFAVLTQGKKTDNVIRFLGSIREHEPKPGDSEILIVGPQDESYEEYGVKYIDKKQFRDDEYAEISKKKNVIIETASKSNLMIVHDRFVLGDDFFPGFEKWGYDFDFITVSQHTEDGQAYPEYAATNEYMRPSGQIWVKELRHLYDTQYLNGGLIIFKTHMAKKIHFNDMLMWGQMEDVELSQVCMEHGIIPRVNFVSEVMVLEVSKGYMASWKVEEETSVEESRPWQAPMSFSLVNRISSRIPERLKTSRLYKKLKRIYWAGRST